MTPFRPSKRQTLRTYYEVPADVLENRNELTRWARDAVRAQVQIGAKPKGGAAKRRKARPG